VHLLLFTLTPLLKLLHENLLPVATLRRGFAVQFELSRVLVRARLDTAGDHLLPLGRRVSGSV